MRRRIVAERVRSSPIGEGLTHDHVTRQLATSSVPAGRPVLAPGDARDLLTFVVAGCVKIVARMPAPDPGAGHPPAPITVQFARPGHVIGLTLIAGHAGRGPFEAVAHEDSIVTFASRDVVRDIVAAASPEYRLGMLAYHARAMSRLIYDKTVLLGLDVRRRLVRELTELHRVFGGSDPRGGIPLALNHRDLAELIGASREHVTRTLLELVREKVVRVEQRRLHVRIPASRASPPAPPRPHAGVPVRDTRPIAGLTDELHLPRSVAGIIRDGVEITAYEAGQRIATDREQTVTILVDGAARVMADTASAPVGVWIAKPWQFLATGRAGRGAMRAAFRSVAIERCLVATLAAPVLSRVLGKLSPDEMLAFLNASHVALSRQLYSRCVMLSLGNAERLLYQLQILARDFPARSGANPAIALSLRPRVDLAALIGVGPTALSRAWTDLETAGRVRVEPGGRLVIRGPR